jgi:hypothetical protein
MQTVFGRFPNPEDAWSWFLPTVIPTLTLMIGGFVADAQRITEDNRSIGITIYRLTITMSIFYFFVVLMTICSIPFTVLSPVELLRKSNLWLVPLQGLVTAALGAFFVKTEKGLGRG